MSRLFNKLPGPPSSSAGLEHKVWRKLPAIFAWGTLLPLLLALANRFFSGASSMPKRNLENGLLLFDYTMIGLVSFHWTMVFTVAIGCLIVRVMKGPAYVADAYPLPPKPQGDIPH
jgi:hypothetical protein